MKNEQSKNSTDYCHEVISQLLTLVKNPLYKPPYAVILWQEITDQIVGFF